MTKTIGLPWRAVQCGASAAAVTGGGVERSLICFGVRRRGIFVLVRFFFDGGIDDLHLGLVVHAQAAHHHHLFAGPDAAQDLHLVAFADTQLDLLLVGGGIRADRQDGRALFFSRKNGGDGHHGGGLEHLGDDHGVHAGAGLELFAGILGLHPDLHGGAGGVRGGAHHNHFAGHFLPAIDLSDGGRVAHLYRAGLALRNIDAGHHARDIHHREQRRAGGGHFTGVQRPVGDHAADGAEDPRIAELGFERLMMRLGGFHLRGGGLDLFLFGDGLEHPQMLLGGFELALGLRVAHQGFIHLAPRQRAFLEQLLAAVEHLFGGIHGLPVCVHIGLRLDHRLGNGRARGGAQIGFRLVHGAFAFGGLGGEVAVLQHGQKLALLHVVAAVDVELLHRRGDLGHDAGLVPREEHAVAG